MGREARDELVDSLLEGAPLAVAVVDRNWCVTRVNGLAAGILGKRPADLLGHDLWAAAGLKGTAYEEPCRTAAAHGAAGTFEDGSQHEVHVTPAGGGLVLWWLDVSGRRRQAERTLRLRELAHDLRTPLTVIGLNAELLAALAARRGDAAEQQKAEAVERAAEQLAEIARQLSATLREGTP